MGFNIYLKEGENWKFIFFIDQSMYRNELSNGWDIKRIHAFVVMLNDMKLFHFR